MPDHTLNILVILTQKESQVNLVLVKFSFILMLELAFNLIFKLIFFFETRSHITQTVLKLDVYPVLALNIFLSLSLHFFLLLFFVFPPLLSITKIYLAESFMWKCPWPTSTPQSFRPFGESFGALLDSSVDQPLFRLFSRLLTWCCCLLVWPPIWCDPDVY